MPRLVTLSRFFSKAAAALCAALTFIFVLTACSNPAGAPEPVRHTLTFDSQGGSEVQPITADTGTSVAKPRDPTKEGYAFQGWFSAVAEGTEYAWPHTLNATITMYARWQAALTEQEQAAVDGFVEDETVKEALEAEAEEIDLETPAQDLGGIEAKVEEALAAYDALPEKAKEALADEKAKLEAVKDKIGNVNAAHDFLDAHEETLGKDPEELTSLADAVALLPDLEDALAELGALPDPVKELLEDDRAVLESLKEKAEEIANAGATEEDRAAAESFRETYANILGKETAALADEAAVEAALSAYEALSEAAQTLLLTEYEKLVRFKEAIGALKPADITYTAAANGSAGTETSTVITLIFSAAVTDLAAGDITLADDGGSAARGALSGDGQTWTLTLASVARAGNVRVSISKAGIDSAFKTVAVHKAGETPVRHTITFDSAGGSEVPAITEDAGVRVPEPAPAPVRTGYTFQGWFDAVSGGDLYEWPHTLTADVTMRAQWTAVSYAITYNLDGGTNPGSPPTSYTIETSGVTLPIPAKTGYAFDGWHDNASLTGAAITGISGGSMGDKAFYAKWTAIAYTVAYDANGGSGTTASSSHTYGVAKALAANGFSRTGYAFAGWNTAADGAGVNYAETQSVTNLADTQGTTVTLYARWQVIYTITFNSHGGPAVAAITRDAGTTATKPADPHWAGKNFSGWFDAETGGTLYNWPYTLNANVTMHAQWTDAVTHTITFDSHDGSVVAPITDNEGWGVAKPEDPTRAGYIFDGWFDAANGGTKYAWPHVLNADVTMHAQWLVDEGTVAVNVSIWVSEDGSILVSGDDITISKTGANEHDMSFTAAVAGDYTGVQWSLDGIPIGGSRGAAQSISIRAMDYTNGTYTLGVTVLKGGTPHSTGIRFTVEN